MKLPVSLLTFLLSFSPLWAQKIPSTLDHPATPKLETKYELAYRNLKWTRDGFWAGLCVTAAGGGLTYYAMNNHSDEGCNPAIVPAVFGYLLTLTGGFFSVECVGLNLASRGYLHRLSEKNDFLNMPGESVDSWKRYRATRAYESSWQWMKISGIAAGCFWGFGAIGCLNNDNDFFYNTTESALWLALGSTATFLVSSMVHFTSRRISIRPSLTSLSSPDFAAADRGFNGSLAFCAAAPGRATSGIDASGTAAPGTITHGTAAPGIAALGIAAPGTVTHGTHTPGTATSGFAAPGQQKFGTSASGIKAAIAPGLSLSLNF